MNTVEITGLTVYPVKSMKGIDIDRGTLTPLGLENDRRWMVVRGSGRFVTQREMPGMALMRASLESEALVLSRQGHGSVQVRFDRDGGQPVISQVWKDECETLDEGREVSDWLTCALESKERLRLVRMAPGFVRPQSRGKLLGETTTTLFADAAPFLVTNESSLEALNQALESRDLQAVPMNRFRPNIVVRGLEAFAEHDIPELSGASYRIGFRHPCQRCIVTTIDQATAARNQGWQPYKTLVKINPMPGNEKTPAFGQNAVLASGQGQAIRIGDRLSFD